MCSIFGFIGTNDPANKGFNEALEDLLDESKARGRDGYGFEKVSNLSTSVHRTITRLEDDVLPAYPDFNLYESGSVIGNFRAEPTTEFVKDKSLHDQQPYVRGDWSIVHNGTIANDAELRTGSLTTSIDSAAIVEQLSKAELTAEKAMSSREHGERSIYDVNVTFAETIRKLKGSFAIIARHTKFPGTLFVACNYKPIWFKTNEHGTYLASTNRMLDGIKGNAAMVKPYTCAVFNADGQYSSCTLHPLQQAVSEKVLVVCSGGLDSVTAATWAVKCGYAVELVHFAYGCRAEQHEVEAVHEVAKYLDVPVNVIPIGIYDKSDSPILNTTDDIAQSEEGAEFAHEWVPARNLLLLSTAAAYAEAKGFTKLILGNNLEEAGAYPDNEPEFINKFNELLPFAVGDGKRLEVLQPLGNLMKHEVVKLGDELGAPLHLTWSCYKQGDQHCGQCGPCFMRKTAFEINGLEEVISYECDE